MTFGDQLSELRKDKRYTQKEIAQVLNLSDSSISNYEKGVNFPDFVTLVKFADLFEVSTDFLLGITNIRTSYNKRKSEKIGDLTLDDFIKQVLSLDKKHRSMMFEHLKLVEVNYKNRTSSKQSK